MKESENVSLFIASFYEKKFLKLYFSYFREEINSTQGFMKKLSITILFFLLAFCQINAQQAKYVFYFIGDGMGVNQVQGTELYLGELEGKIGITPLQFTQFPYTTVATTFSATNGVTDSAAAGTALATGNKTKNGAIGVLKDLQTPVYSVATWAKERGCRVGVATSVSVDHATPAAFYDMLQVEEVIMKSEKTYMKPVLISMPVQIFFSRRTRKIRKQPTFTHWLINTDTPLPEDIKIISRRAKKLTR